MDELLAKTKEALEAARKIGPKGGEYWVGRELQEILGYAKWENFEGVIERAMQACMASGVEVKNRFLRFGKTVPSGSGTQVEKFDYYVDRYACYLIAMNGDPKKIEIATAQTYFAVKTRLYEVDQEHALIEKRSQQRDRITNAVKGLISVAKQAGLQDYARFHDAGYRGLYAMGLRDIRRQKGLAEKEDIYDRQGPTEMAANEFRLTQTKDKIERERIAGQANLEAAHHTVGKKVRSTIAEIGGTMPERLAPAPSLKKQLSEQKKKAKALSKAAPQLPTPKP